MNETSTLLNIGPSGGAGLSHATIIRGGSEDERYALAQRLAMALLCEGPGEKPCGTCAHCEKARRGIHPDILTYDQDEQTRTIYVDQIRALRDDAVVMPNEASRKVYIIRHAGAMNSSAQNALLKVLEEPPGGAAFILTAETYESLLPTVRSRCTTFSADAGHTAGQKAETALATEFIDAVPDALKLAALSFKLDKLDKGAFIDFIEDAKTAVARRLRSCAGAQGAPEMSALIHTVQVLDRAKEYLHYNIGLVHITGMLSAELTIRNEEDHD